MRWATWTELLAVAVSALGAGCGAPVRPDILVVTIDTLRRDHVGVYGDDRGLTPHLDALAAEGLVHDAAFTTMPTTGPAHLSLFTGLHPSDHGSRRNGDPLPKAHAARELGALLRARGYATAAFVSTPLMLQRDIGLRGFEIYDPPTGRLRHGESAVEAALAWLDAEPRRPVFLWVHLYDPHAPYGTPDDKRRSFPVEPGLYGFVEIDRYLEPEARLDMEELYRRGVRNADTVLGVLLEGVRARVERPPLVVVTSDHGESLAEHLDSRGFGFDHGKYLDVETVAIPLVVSGPGIPPGRSEAAVSIRDLYTTILEAAGVGDPRAASEGRRDLRTASDAPRVVRIERRTFRRADVPDSVRTHAAAASDGEGMVLVGEDGTARWVFGMPRDSLVRAARRGLAEEVGGAERALPRETREALRDLGYLE